MLKTNYETNEEKSKLIRAISAAGDECGSALISFMEAYALGGLREATVEQLREYATRRGILNTEENSSADAAASGDGMRFMGRDPECSLLYEERG